MSRALPRIFVGSSSEALNFAEALQTLLEGDALVSVWRHGVFGPSEYALESLTTAVDHADFAALILSRDDLVNIRGISKTIARDNVVFELGLCIGKLGLKRTFAVTARTDDLRVPTDLLGLNLVMFDSDDAVRDPVAALGPAASKIRSALKRPNEYPIPPDLRRSILGRRASLSPTMLRILNYVEVHHQVGSAALAEQLSIAVAEARYRLEVLRLLSFVDVNEKFDYYLHPAYVQILLSIGAARRPET